MISGIIKAEAKCNQPRPKAEADYTLLIAGDISFKMPKLCTALKCQLRANLNVFRLPNE